MLDARFIRENEALVRQSLTNRNYDMSVLEKFLEVDKKWRSLTEEGNSLRQKRNEVSEQIPKLSKDQKQAKITEMKAIAERIREIESEVKGLESTRDENLLLMPNVPDPSVPIGATPEDDPIVKTWGQVRQFDFNPLNHWQIGERLDILDF